MKFPIKDFFSQCEHIFTKTLHLFTFTKEILNAKLQFLCSGSNCKYRKIFYENKKVVQNGLQLIQKLRIAKSLNIYIL